MKSTLLLSGEWKEIADYLSCSLEGYFDIEISQENHPAISALILLGAKTTSELYQKYKGKVPCLLVLPDKNASNENYPGFLQDDDRNRQLAFPFLTSDILNAGMAMGLTLLTDGYVRVRTARVINTGPSGVAIFIRLGNAHYVKIHDVKDAFDPTILKKYQEKGMQFFYLKDSDFEQYLKATCHDVTAPEPKSEVAPAPKPAAALSPVEKIHKQVQDIGIDSESIRMTYGVIASAMTTIKRNKTCSKITEIMQKQQNFVAEHGQLTAYISCAIAEHMEWKSDTLMEKLVYASLFHNISLADSDLAKIHSSEDPKFQSLSREDQLKVKLHGQKSASILEGLPDYTDDLKSLIINHHERPDDKGFPRSLTAFNINPADGLFILSVQFANELINRGNSQEIMNKIVEEFAPYYNKGNLQKPYEGFVKVFKK